MAIRKIRVGIDFSTLDHLTLGNGQYRYIVDLINGLGELCIADFILFGSRPLPPPETQNLFGGTRWTYVQVCRADTRFGYLWAHLRYGLLAVRHRIDVWHAPHAFVSALCLSRLVVTEHDLMYDIFNTNCKDGGSKRYQFHRFLVRHRADHVICISGCTQRDLLRLFPMPVDKTSIVYHGTSLHNHQTTHAEAPGVLRSLGRSFWIASPYNLEPRKNLKSLLIAFRDLTSKFPELKLVLFGKAAVTEERESEYERLVGELGTEDKIIRTGYLTDGELAWVYKNCTVFAFPSLYEGFGLPILEAMANGACVVARNASAMSEIVADAGALVDTTKPKELAAQMAILLDDPVARLQFAERARSRARLFSIERMVRSTFKVYLQVLGIRGPSASAV